MNWLLVIEIVYVLIILLVCMRIIYDTTSTTKTLAYVLLVVFIPVAGILVYFSFGINYRKRKMYTKRIFDKDLEQQLSGEIRESARRVFEDRPGGISRFSSLAQLVANQSFSPVTDCNEVSLLINGEQKFPEVMRSLEAARDHIHLEYYIFEPDTVGRAIIDVLIRKASEGVKIRFIYDDFGSRRIRKKEVKRMREAGIEVYPFYKILLVALANRMNYRNHRKIIIIDGITAFTGGINVCDKYVNDPAKPKKLFWRDTHLKISGPSVQSLQYIFMGDWNYCSGQKLIPDRKFFPRPDSETPGSKCVQVVSSGPDSDTPLILHSLCGAISLSTAEVLITSPYFIPEDTVMDTLMIAAYSGISVKLLVPGKSDSLLVNLANHSNFGRLLKAGIEIYTYQKGFDHAKTMVADSGLAVVGTANMDQRSFDLNFEVNVMVYDPETNGQLREAFYRDLLDAEKIDPVAWENRPKHIRLIEKIVGLVSPLM